MNQFTLFASNSGKFVKIRQQYFVNNNFFYETQIGRQKDLYQNIIHSSSAFVNLMHKN